MSAGRPWVWIPVSDALPLADLIRTLNQRMSLLARAAAASAGTPVVASLPNGSTTPSVAGADVWVEQNTAPTSITAFTGGVAGQRFLLWATTANTTLVNGPTLVLLEGANVTMAATESRTFATVDGTTWREVTAPEAIWA